MMCRRRGGAGIYEKVGGKVAWQAVVARVGDMIREDSLERATVFYQVKCVA
jgi:hypothetical protein